MSHIYNEFKLEEATIASVHLAMEKGLINCRQLVEMYIKRIQDYDQKGPRLNSVIRINPKALETADQLDKKFKESGFTGSLHGIPVLLKDNINTNDMPTTGGSLSLKDFLPEEEAFITRKLKEAGAIVLAKVNLHEFAIWGETVSSILGQTLNPYDLTRTPGGSSGGTGAGIAANFAIIGIGTDTINSIRSPASACNLIGFRPTLGLVSRSGIIPYSLTQDTAGPIMRTVEDTAKVLDIISGYDMEDPITAWSIGHIPKTYTDFLNKDGLQGKTIGILKSFFGKEKIHEEVNTIIYSSLEEMKNNGAILIDIEEEIDTDKLVNEVSVHLYELKSHLNSYLEKAGAEVEVSSLTEIIESGKYHKGIEENIKLAETLNINSLEYNKRLVKREELKNLIMEIMAKYNLDAIVYPHQKQPVVKIGKSQVDRNGVIGSVTGFPSCVVPAGFTKPRPTAPIGLPVGLEILARQWSEPILFEIAYGFEYITNHRRLPLCK